METISNPDNCISLGVEKICNACIDNYLSNIGGLCFSNFYYNNLKYYDRDDVRKGLIKHYILYYPNDIYYLTSIINIHFPLYNEFLNKLLVLK